jgi:hypothetical protein
MKQNLLRLITAFALLFFAQAAFSQGSTTSGINGQVIGNDGETLPGATVIAVEASTGSQYGTVTDLDGFYRLPNMNVGGPYKVTISFVGFEPYEKDGIFLQLGQTLKLDVNLSEQATALSGVEIVAMQNDVFDGNRTGAETFVSNQDIAKMPTIDRSIADFARITPQAKVSSNGAISVAGMNNRYNAISIQVLTAAKPGLQRFRWMLSTSSRLCWLLTMFVRVVLPVQASTLLPAADPTNLTDRPTT